ncbi:MAG: hypothetical protein WDN03_03980 [Rhizomicrobium sp.]
MGEFLGFDADRPEKLYQVGPDVLWRTDADFDFVIEAKSKKEPNSPLFKSEHAQLLEAQHWFEGEYPGRNSTRVSALPKPVADTKATSEGTMALRLSEIARLVTALRGVLIDLVDAPGTAEALRERCESSLTQARLKPAQLRETFLVPFSKVAQK